MSQETTTLLNLPLLMASQAQKHITHNEALGLLDAVVQMSVRARAGVLPVAATLQDGDRFLVAAGASGAFAGHVGEIAFWSDAALSFLTPRAGWLCWIEADRALLVHHQGIWQDVPARLVEAAMIGVNATADAVNRLSVRSQASLFSHEGSSHQLKINRNAVTDRASILFQTGFAGKAEIGLVGGDDFVFKVSPDGGASFIEAIRIAGATGLDSAKRKPPVPRRFSAGGIWTKPDGLSSLAVIVVGAGGGGGGTAGNGADAGAGGGGGAGGVAVSILDAAVLGPSVAVTVGTGGTGRAGGTGTATAGGSSSFGALGAATGGDGGASRVASASLGAAPGGGGGLGSGGNLWNAAGQAGGSWRAPTGDIISGEGGSAFLGAGARGVNPAAGTVEPGLAAGSPGAGGSGSAVRGGATASGTGGRGADGFVILVEMF